MSQQRTGGETAACIIAEHIDEAIEILVDRFLVEYPQSDSATLSTSSLRIWTRDYLDELQSTLNGGAAAIRLPDIYTGDMLLRADPLFKSLYTYTETWLFIARTMAPFIWHHCQSPREAEPALEALEEATRSIIRESLVDFAQNKLVAGSLSREWSFSSNEQNQSAGVHDLPTSPSAAPAARHTPLTAREREVARLVAAGKTNGEIAGTMGIAQSTVKNHLSRIYDKLNVNTRTELARWAMDNGVG